MSGAHTGPEYRARLAARFRAMNRDPEFREKRRLAKEWRWKRDADYRRRETARLMAMRLAMPPATAEMRAAAGERMRALWASPEGRRKLMAKRKRGGIKALPKSRRYLYRKMTEAGIPRDEALREAMR